jgi:hypothetical protein
MNTYELLPPGTIVKLIIDGMDFGTAIILQFDERHGYCVYRLVHDTCLWVYPYETDVIWKPVTS